MQFNGQAAQDLFVLTVLNEKKNGTFVEIGAHHPVWISNTFKLEKTYKWTGLMVEYNPSYLPLYKKERPNSTHLIQDATTIDFSKVFEEMKMPENIDYLQIDLEVQNNSTFKTLANIEQQVMNKYKFAVVTFEHDIYCGNYFDTRKKSRELFDRNGYYRVFSDVSNEGNVFEDWYVYPQLVDMDFIKSIKRDESMGWTEILPLLWKPFPTFEKQKVTPTPQTTFVEQKVVTQQQTENKIENQKYIIINCENPHLFKCGLGDRLQGFACCIALGNILNRKVLVKWKTPDISKFFDISDCDYYKQDMSFKSKSSIVIDAGGDQTKVKQRFMNNDIFNEWKKYDVLDIMCNTNPLIYIFMNSNVDGVNHRDYEKIYQSACREIFVNYLKPIDELKDIIGAYAHDFKADKPTIGFQIRTGDAFFDSRVTSFYPIESKCESIVSLLTDTLIKLENNNFEDNLKDKYNVFLTYDNPKIIPYLSKITDGRKTFYLDYPVGHFGLQREDKEMLKQYADIILLSQCDALVVSHFSNFGRVPFIINESQDKFTLAIINEADEFGNTLGLGKNDSSIEFKIYKPSILDMSCKHPDWKLLHEFTNQSQLQSDNLRREVVKSPFSNNNRLELVGRYGFTIF